jgi:predicted DNA-binding protein (MmcQ/YjbR family)
MPPSPLTRLRKICLALPEAHEVEAWGEPTFRVNNKLFAMYASATNHHGAGHHAVWVKSTPINQSLMIAAKPNRYFSPPYVGPSGWVGVRLDGRVNWKELADVLRDAYDITVAKKKSYRKPKRATARRTLAP